MEQNLWTIIVGLIILGGLILVADNMGVLSLGWINTVHKVYHFGEAIDFQTEATNSKVCNVPKFYVKLEDLDCATQSVGLRVCCGSATYSASTCSGITWIKAGTSPQMLALPASNPALGCDLSKIQGVDVSSLTLHLSSMSATGAKMCANGVVYDGAEMNFDIWGYGSPTQFSCDVSQCIPSAKTCQDASIVQWTECIGGSAYTRTDNCATKNQRCQNGMCVALQCNPNEVKSVQCTASNGVVYGTETLRCDSRGYWVSQTPCPTCTSQVSICSDGSSIQNTICGTVALTQNKCPDSPIPPVQPPTGSGTGTGTGTGSGMGCISDDSCPTGTKCNLAAGVCVVPTPTPKPPAAEPPTNWNLIILIGVAVIGIVGVVFFLRR